MDRMRQTRNFDRTQMQDLRSAINYIIEKDYPKQNITLKNRIGRDQYSYSEIQPFQWKILNETAKIGEYNTQKAETQYGAREPRMHGLRLKFRFRTGLINSVVCPALL